MLCSSLLQICIIISTIFVKPMTTALENGEDWSLFDPLQSTEEYRPIASIGDGDVAFQSSAEESPFDFPNDELLLMSGDFERFDLFHL